MTHDQGDALAALRRQLDADAAFTAATRHLLVAPSAKPAAKAAPRAKAAPVKAAPSATRAPAPQAKRGPTLRQMTRSIRAELASCGMRAGDLTARPLMLYGATAAGLVDRITGRGAQSLDRAAFTASRIR